MTYSTKRPIIALDCDGVLLDYNRAFAKHWHKFTGIAPIEIDPQAYWHMNRWTIQRLSGERLMHWRAFMDHDFWSSIPAIPGALEACKRLQESGHDLVCVTALHSEFAAARERNLRDLGFPISKVYTTGNERGINPKRAVIHEIEPEAFVDDFLLYFDGIEPKIHTALILREANGSPNTGPALDAVSSKHPDLTSFADWWCDELI